jgi:hypothetical protein
MKYYSSNYEVLSAWYNKESETGRNSNESIYFENTDVVYSWGSHFPLAVRLPNGFILCNGDYYSNSTAHHQSELFGIISNEERAEIPFSALGNLEGLDRGGRWSTDYDIEEIQKLEIKDHKKDGWIEKEVDGETKYEHQLGAVLIGHRGKDYLSAIDETGSGNGTYFLTELLDKVSTIDEAYQSLKPRMVKEVELGNLPEHYTGKVKRQGEWFFLEMTEDYERKKRNQLHHNGGTFDKKYILEPKDEETRTGHHKATTGFKLKSGKQFVRGTVRHIENDHSLLKLYEGTEVRAGDRRFYRAIENRQGMSWGAVGDVD